MVQFHTISAKVSLFLWLKILMVIKQAPITIGG